MALWSVSSATREWTRSSRWRERPQRSRRRLEPSALRASASPRDACRISLVHTKSARACAPPSLPRSSQRRTFMLATMRDEQLLVPRARASGFWEGAAVEGEARIRVHQRGIVPPGTSGRGWACVRRPSGLGECRRTNAVRVVRKSDITSQTPGRPVAGEIERACGCRRARGARPVDSRAVRPLASALLSSRLDARSRRAAGTARQITALDGATMREGDADRRISRSRAGRRTARTARVARVGGML